MSPQFSAGYALLIAVNENAVAEYALPDVAMDIAAVEAVLKHEERCAYDPAHISVIMGKDATRQAIVDGLDWLEEQIREDDSGNATALIYYSGHGWRDGSASPPTYHLIPYDMRPGPISPRALRAEDFAAAVSALSPRRLLVILDCCHSGGMGVKVVEPIIGGFAPAAAPATLFMSGAKGVVPAEGAKGLDTLSQGTGRAVLTSSQGAQLSYIRKDRRMSIFTYHLIEAFTGHARPEEGATEVLVSDVMGHVWRRVPESAQQDWGRDQQPDYQVTGNFPVALLLGGKGLSRGMPPPDPLVPPLEGSRTDITGDGNVIGDQSSSTVVRTTVGDISNSTGIAIGSDIRVNVTMGISGQELDRLFGPVLQAVHAAPAEKLEQALRGAEDLKAEVAKGSRADDNRMATLIDGLVALVPSAASAVVSIFATPVLGGLAGPVTRFVLDRIQGK